MNYNMNENMNEQDLILKKKIEKREKMDTILAYILIVILLVAIVLVLYLKFIREDDTDTLQDEYVPNYISLSEISSSLNSSSLASGYQNDNATFSSSVMDDELVINYTKDDVNITLNGSVIGNEILLDISNENTDIVSNIYKEIASIICVYYGNDVNACNNTLSGVSSDNSIQGIRYVSDDNTNSVYIDMTRSIDVNSEITYNTVTQTSIYDTNYNLNLLDVKISNINITKSDDSISFSGNVERLNSDNFDFSILVKLYDNTDNLLGENSIEYNVENPLDSNNIFVVDFMSDNINISDISKYSIEIVR